MTESREPIYCDCCGKEIVAMIIGDRVVIIQRRHGKEHCRSLTLDMIKELIENKSVSVSVN